MRKEDSWFEILAQDHLEFEKLSGQEGLKEICLDGWLCLKELMSEHFLMPDIGKSLYYWKECIYTLGNTFRANYWDGLAGIAMILKGGFGVWGCGWWFFRRALFL